MRRAFVDSSALLALLVRSDRFHDEARRRFEGLLEDAVVLVSSSYVLIETYALAGGRYGLQYVGGFRRDFAPLLSIIWVAEALHERGLDLLLRRGRRELSLVDAVSFELMRNEGIEEALAFDPDFEREGFSLVV